MHLLNIALGSTLLAVVLAAMPVAALAGKTRAVSNDAALVTARDAFRAGDRARLVKAMDKLKGHVLEPYVEYWLLRLHLEEATPTQVHAYLSRHPDTLLAEQLRKDWLRVLAKYERWDWFREEYPSAAGDDIELACYSLLARWQQGDRSAFAGLKFVWTLPRELPEGCLPIARAMAQSGELTARDVWQRFRVLAAGNMLLGPARRTLEWLPQEGAAIAKRLDGIVGAPVRFLEKPAGDLKRRSGRELYILALAREARNDPQVAAGYWDRKTQEQFPPEDQAYVWGLLAMQGARRHIPESLDWFLAAGDAALDDEQLAWKVRIALRLSNWSAVKNAIGRMSPVARNDPAWIYWQGRAIGVLGSLEDAKAQFGRIAGEHNFYGRLAAEELDIVFQLPQPAPITGEELAAIESTPGLQRALALYRLGLRTEGMREWNWTVRGMEDRKLLAAAELARRNELWDRAINTADRTLSAHDFSARYLAPYREVLATQARTQKLEEPWVLGLVRQESRFIADARSSAGAAGLMQLMPATAQWVARRLGMKDYSWAHVTDPEVNAALGTSYLKHVLDDLAGSPVLAAAAYNAGPGRARRWRDARPLEGAIYAESIPFNETRDYVKKVMANSFYYSAVLGAELRPLKSRMGTVPGAGPAGFVAIEERRKSQ